MKWTEEKTNRLIQLFREKRELWDPTNEHFENRTKKNETWSDLSARLGTSQEILKNKMKRLVVIFDLEVDKRRSGRIQKDYQEWCFYRSLLFLKERTVTIKPSIELVSTDENVLEKTKMWDWVLLMASLLTALYVHFIQQHGYWRQGLVSSETDLTQTQSPKEWPHFNIDKFLTEDDEVCSLDWEQSWVPTKTIPGNNCFYVKLHILDHIIFKTTDWKLGARNSIRVCRAEETGKGQSFSIMKLTMDGNQLYTLHSYFQQFNLSLLNNETSEGQVNTAYICNNTRVAIYISGLGNKKQILMIEIGFIAFQNTLHGDQYAFAYV